MQKLKQLEGHVEALAKGFGHDTHLFVVLFKLHLSDMCRTILDVDAGSAVIAPSASQCDPLQVCRAVPELSGSVPVQ